MDGPTPGRQVVEPWPGRSERIMVALLSEVDPEIDWVLRRSLSDSVTPWR